MYLTLSSAGEKYHLRQQTIRVGRESMIWKCLVSCGSKPIDRCSSATSTLSAKSAARYTVFWWTPRTRSSRLDSLTESLTEDLRLRPIKPPLRRMQTLRAVDRCCLQSSRVRDIDFAVAFRPRHIVGDMRYKPYASSEWGEAIEA